MKTTFTTLAFAAILAFGLCQSDAQERKVRFKLKDDKQTKKESSAKPNRIKLKQKNSVSQSNSLPTKNSNRISLKSSTSANSSTSTVVQRLQRKPNGDLIQKSPAKKPALATTNKRMGVRFNTSPKSLKTKVTSKKAFTKPNPKRFAGKFKSPTRSIGQTGTSKRPFTGGNPKRFAGSFQSPKSLLNSATSQRPRTTTLTKNSPPKSKFKMGGAVKKGMGGLAVAGVANGMLNDSKKNKELLKSGKISKSQYNKLQTTNGLKTAGELYKLKKLNPASAVMNDVIGTDPISLGVEGIGDLINGTDNAKQSLKGMKDSWNKSLTKQAFTDPKGAGKRIKKGVKDTTKKVGNGIKKAGKKVGEFFKSKKKKKKRK